VAVVAAPAAIKALVAPATHISRCKPRLLQGSAVGGHRSQRAHFNGGSGGGRRQICL
jgi:hypothetical protein